MIIKFIVSLANGDIVFYYMDTANTPLQYDTTKIDDIKQALDRFNAFVSDGFIPLRSFKGVNWIDERCPNVFHQLSCYNIVKISIEEVS